MTKEEAKVFIETYEGENIELINPESPTENEYFKTQIGEATGKAYQEVDNVLNELGLDKQGKTSETVKFHVTSLNQKLTKLADVEKNYATTLEELENVKKNGVKDEDLIKQLDAKDKSLAEMQDAFKLEKSELSNQLDAFKTNAEKQKINELLRKELPENLNHEDKAYLEHKINESLNGIINGYSVKVEDGKLIVTNKDNSYISVKTNELLKDTLKDFIGKKKVDLSNNPPTKIILSSASTKSEAIIAVKKTLLDEGLKPTDINYQKRHKELLKEVDFINLPH